MHLNFECYTYFPQLESARKHPFPTEVQLGSVKKNDFIFTIVKYVLLLKVFIIIFFISLNEYQFFLLIFPHLAKVKIKHCQQKCFFLIISLEVSVPFSQCSTKCVFIFHLHLFLFACLFGVLRLIRVFFTHMKKSPLLVKVFKF